MRRNRYGDYSTEQDAPMSQRRISNNRRVHGFPRDFPQRLERFQRESGLSWAELARRLGTDPETVRRWKKGRTRPNAEHLLGLWELADELALGRLFRD